MGEGAAKPLPYLAVAIAESGAAAFVACTARLPGLRPESVMILRPALAAAAFALLAFPARAGGDGCAGDCYRQTWSPARYGMAVEKHIVQAPRTYGLYTPAEYRTVTEKIVVRPAGRVWSVTRDSHGRKIGCWVETPAEYATVSRRVQVRAAELVPYAQTTAYGYRSHPVLVEPGHLSWTPVGHGRPHH